MSSITIERAGEFCKSLFSVLRNQPAGLPARDVIAQIPRILPLSEDELKFAPNSAQPRYEKIIRVSVIPLEKAGWIQKSDKGIWRITREGREADLHYPRALDFYQEALRLYEYQRKFIPENIMAIETAQESAWAQIQKHLQHLTLQQVLSMLSELLRAMGYYPTWSAPLQKHHGRIDLVAYTDPLGMQSTRILTQVRHKGQPVTVEGIKGFASMLLAGDFGIIFSTAGFTAEAEQEIAQFSNLNGLDAATFFDLWEMHYPRLTAEARHLLPLKAVNFLAMTE